MGQLVTFVSPMVLLLWGAYLFQKYIRLIVNLFLGVQIRMVPEEEMFAKGERLMFAARDGVRLSGILVPPRGTAVKPLGTVVFSHEFGSNKNSCLRYADFLLDTGFQIFAFDYRNHGDSDKLESYEPRHWFTEHEVSDLDAALDFIESRDQTQRGKIALFGISRGAATSLYVGSRRSSVFAVLSDSAFSTYRTLVDYERKWISIFAKRRFFYRRLPGFVYSVLARTALLVSRLRLGTRFPSVERRLRECTCPVLYVHGRQDTYIDWQQAHYLAGRTGGPHRLLIVPGARHNHSRFVESALYEKTVTEFLLDALGSRTSPAGVGAQSG